MMVLPEEMTFGLRMNDGIETTTQRPGGVSAMKVRGGTGQDRGREALSNGEQTPKPGQRDDWKGFKRSCSLFSPHH